MSRHRNSWSLIVAVMLVALTAAPAAAHQLNLFAAAEGRTLAGEAYFRGGTPVSEAAVKVYDPAGVLLGETKTDQAGKFTFECRNRCDHRLVIEVDGGHGAEFTVTAGELPEDLPPRGETAGAAPSQQSPAAPAAAATVSTAASSDLRGEVRALGRQVAELRRELARYQGEIRVRDVIGGVGYIVGAMGLWFFLRGGRAARRSSPV